MAIPIECFEVEDEGNDDATTPQAEEQVETNVFEFWEENNSKLVLDIPDFSHSSDNIFSSSWFEKEDIDALISEKKIKASPIHMCFYYKVFYFSILLPRTPSCNLQDNECFVKFKKNVNGLLLFNGKVSITFHWTFSKT